MNEVSDGFLCKLSLGGNQFDQVVEIELPERSVGEFETTKLDQTGKGKTFNPSSFVDNGKITFSTHYTPQAYKAVNDLLGAPAATIVFTDNAPATTKASATCNGFVQVVGSVKRNKEGGAMFSTTLRVSGDFTYSKGTT